MASLDKLHAVFMPEPGVGDILGIIQRLRNEGRILELFRRYRRAILQRLATPPGFDAKTVAGFLVGIAADVAQVLDGVTADAAAIAAAVLAPATKESSTPVILLRPDTEAIVTAAFRAWSAIFLSAGNRCHPAVNIITIEVEEVYADTFIAAGASGEKKQQSSQTF